MNKILKRLSILSIACFMLFLVGCDNNVKPYIEFTRETPLRTTFDLDFDVFDQDEILVNLIAEIFENDSTTAKEKKTVSLDEDGVTNVTDFRFSNLSEHNTYKIVFTGTYNGKAHVIATVTGDTSDGGSSEAPHEISTADDLAEVKDDEDGHFILKNDIDYDGKQLNSFFTSSRKFSGTFDGGNFTISNFTQDSYETYLGLFGYIDSKGTVKDLNIENFTVKSQRYADSYVGGVAGLNLGTITNVNIKDVTLTTVGPSDGGQFVGGFVGENQGTGTIEDCTASNIKIDLNAPTNFKVGGFVGLNQYSDVQPVIKNVEAINVLIDVQVDTDPGYTADSAKVDTATYLGGFVGDNRGIITNALAVSKILYYVDNTTLDKNTNPSDFDDDNVVTETDLNGRIDEMIARVGGFAGANSSGRIEDSIANTSVNMEVAYLTALQIGGFAGLNGDNASVINSGVIPGGTFTVTVNEKTRLNSVINSVDTSYVGDVFGLDNSKGILTPYINGTNGVLYTFNVRVKTGTGESATYSFESKTPTKNGIYDSNRLNSTDFASKFDEDSYNKVINAYTDN